MKKIIRIVFLLFLVLMFVSAVEAIESQDQKSEEMTVARFHGGGGFHGGHPGGFHHHHHYRPGNAPQCFIATAAYGNPDHPDVWTLREFRDKWLVGNWAGEEFINFYYKYGPKAAQFIEGREYLRRLVKRGLYPLVEAARYLNALRE